MSQRKKKKSTSKKPAKSGTKKNAPKKKEFFTFTSLDYTLAGILFGLAFLVYANTIGHEYALDDNSVITDSHLVRGGVENLDAIFVTRYREGSFGESSTMYRPMSVAMFAIEWQISPDNPMLSHFVNVFLFAATCFILFLTFKEILGKYSIWIPFVAVGLFAVHPVHTEIVANIKSRDEILVFFFVAIALHFAWRYATKGEKTSDAVISSTSIAAAMFSKENAMNFVVIIPLTLYFFSQLPWQKILKLSIGYVVAALFYCSSRISVLGSMFVDKEIDQIDNFLAHPDISFLEQKATAIWVLGKYLSLLVFPYPLICDYNYDYIPTTDLTNPMVFISLLGHLGLLGYAIYRFKNKDLLSYAILFYLLNMFLYSNLVFTIGAGLGERFLYISSFGFCLALAFIFAKYLGPGVEAKKFKDIKTMFTGQGRLLYVLGMIIIMMGAQTFLRNKDWYNSYTLYSADIEKAPQSARLNGYMGTEYLKKGKDEKDEAQKQIYFDKAIEVYTRAVTIYDDYTEAKGQLGLSYFRKGNYAEASKWYESAIADPGCKGSIYSNYGWLYFNDALIKQQAGDKANFDVAIKKAKEMYDEAIRREPNYADGYMNLGSTLGMMGDHQGAVKNFEIALQYAKDEQKAGIYGNLAKAYEYTGNNQKAEEAKANAIRFKDQ